MKYHENSFLRELSKCSKILRITWHIYRFKIQIHVFIKITWFQHGLIHWRWYWTIVELYPCLPLITDDMEIHNKAWSRCHNDHHKWKRSDSPCNTGCITVFRARFKHMWPRAVNKVYKGTMQCTPILAWFSLMIALKKKCVYFSEGSSEITF